SQDKNTYHTSSQSRSSDYQIVIPLPHFGENLIDHDTVPNANFGFDSETFESRLLAAQVQPELGFRLQQTIEIFLELDQVRIHDRRLSHYVQKCHRRAEPRCQFAG